MCAAYFYPELSFEVNPSKVSHWFIRKVAMAYIQMPFVIKFCSHWKYCNITRNISDLVPKSIYHFNINPANVFLFKFIN